MKKRCKRKTWALVNPVLHAIEGAAICPPHVIDGLRTRELAAIEEFATGTATIETWSDINLMVGMCETMARAGVGRQEVADTCKAVNDALLAAKNDYKATGIMQTSQEGLQAIRDLYEYNDLQRTSISRAEYEKHIARLQRQIKAKSAKILESL